MEARESDLERDTIIRVCATGTACECSVGFGAVLSDGGRNTQTEVQKCHKNDQSKSITLFSDFVKLSKTADLKHTARGDAILFISNWEVLGCTKITSINLLAL